MRGCLRIAGGISSRGSWPAPASAAWSASKIGFTNGLSYTRAVFSEHEFSVARKWFQEFNASHIPRDVGQVSYSRSSGPGGQNVNKVNSKAQLRVPLDRLLPLVPPILHPGIKRSRYYADKSSSLVIHADESRNQSANRDTCYRKLNDMLAEVYKQIVPGETSEEQKEKVKGLKTRENEARLKRKKLLSSKKASRSKSTGDD